MSNNAQHNRRSGGTGKRRSTPSAARSGHGRPRGERQGSGYPRGQRQEGSRTRSRDSAPRASRSFYKPGQDQRILGGRPGAPDARPGPNSDVHVKDGERLQKVLARAGLGSRRACEDLITAGRVQVDGQVVRELGTRVDPDTQVIHVDTLRLQLNPDLVTLALNKPEGVVSTMDDPEGRPTLESWVMNRPERLFHVGRLDTDTQGLIFLTNDGELAHRLTHPRWEIAKTYVAKVEGRVPRGLIRTLRDGVELDDGPAVIDRGRVIDVSASASLVEIELHEGRNRIVRRIFEALGHPVLELTRTAVGPIHLGDLRVGATRVIAGAELGSLMKAVGL